MVDSTNLPEVDINQIATDLNNKMDRDGVNSTASVCIESYHDENGNWYRVYSDGWCEQGGYTDATSVVYLKTFLNTNYNLQVSPHRQQNAQIYWSDLGYSKTVSGFTLRITDTSLDWRACGYIR